MVFCILIQFATVQTKLKLCNSRSTTGGFFCMRFLFSSTKPQILLLALVCDDDMAYASIPTTCSKAYHGFPRICP